MWLLSSLSLSLSSMLSLSLSSTSSSPIHTDEREGVWAKLFFLPRCGYWSQRSISISISISRVNWLFKQRVAPQSSRRENTWTRDLRSSFDSGQPGVQGEGVVEWIPLINATLIIPPVSFVQTGWPLSLRLHWYESGINLRYVVFFSTRAGGGGGAITYVTY